MSAVKLKSATVSASVYGVKHSIWRRTTTARSSASSLQFPSALSSVHILSASPPNSWFFKTNLGFLIGDRKACSSQKYRYFSDKKAFVKAGSSDALANRTSKKDRLFDGDYRNEESELKKNPRVNNLFTLPTVLTIARVAAVPLFVSTFYVDGPWGAKATTGIFIAAAVTDWLDGYLARKLGLGSAFGAFLDPVADKLMVAATLVLLCTRPLNIPLLGETPWLMTIPAIAIIGREITMSAVREWAASQDSKLLEAVAVNKLGKWKTAIQMTALTILLATRDSSLGSPGLLVASGVVLLYISSGLAVWSLVVYMRNIWRVLLK